MAASQAPLHAKLGAAMAACDNLTFFLEYQPGRLGRQVGPQLIRRPER